MGQRLWIISELFPPDETSTAFILGEIANAMAEKYEVRVICGPEVYDVRKKIDHDNTFQIDSRVDVFRVKGSVADKNTIWGKVASFIVISSRLFGALRKGIHAGDKVLIVTNPAPIVVLISRLKRMESFELNILVHDVFPENTVPAGLRLPGIAYGILKKVFDKSYSRADQLIVLGRDMKIVLEQKIARFKHRPKVNIIENWADLDVVYPMRRPTPSDKVVLEYAGNIGRVQGLQSMFDCIRKANNDALYISLWGTGAEEDNLKEYASSYQMRNIVFHGGYLRSRQNEVLNNCDLALVTLSEGMYGLGVPSKTYNIMGAGKAILFIGDPESEIGLLVREKQIGFVFCPEGKDSIVAFLASLSPDRLPDLRAMGERARIVAENEYKKELILNKFLTVL